jgi:hypothetical protein
MDKQGNTKKQTCDIFGISRCPGSAARDVWREVVDLLTILVANNLSLRRSRISSQNNAILPRNAQSIKQTDAQNETLAIPNTTGPQRDRTEPHLENEADDSSSRLTVLGKLGALLLQHVVPTAEVEAEAPLGRHLDHARLRHGDRERRR